MHTISGSIAPARLAENLNLVYIEKLRRTARILHTIPDRDWRDRLKGLASEIEGHIPERVSLTSG